MTIDAQTMSPAEYASMQENKARILKNLAMVTVSGDRFTRIQADLVGKGISVVRAGSKEELADMIANRTVNNNAVYFVIEATNVAMYGPLSQPSVLAASMNTFGE